VPPTNISEKTPALLVHLGAVALIGLMLAAAGQPLFTDDAWWHLAHGHAYASQGPWLTADPLLYTAAGPPTPTAWLSDLALYGVERIAGFPGMRVAHVLLVLAILGLAASLLRRASGSHVAASLGSGFFIALAAYRLVQLRPELLTIFATLALYRVLFERAEPPSWLRVALAAAILGVWANAHAGFLLGPIFITAAAAALIVARPFRSAAQRPQDRARALRLLVALGAGLVATLVNPSGADPYLAYFIAGADTPALMQVADEWAHFQPLRLPVPRLPPSPLAWGIVWTLLAAVPVAAAHAIRSWRAERDRSACVDPVLVALAFASLAALLIAVRFLWLGIFPLLLVAQVHRTRHLGSWSPRPAAVWGAAAVALLLVPTFLRFGDWPMISRGLSFSAGAYAQPYPASKYYARTVWMLSDAGLEGNLYNGYSQGGFLGYWLAPTLRTFVNGSLNVPVEVMNAAGALRARRGLEPGESFLELLDRHRVDVFLGTGLARVGQPNRPYHHTTRHLERAPGWTLVYRDLSSAVYLRANERNRANLERVRGYYAARGVPFDSDRGFEPQRVIREAPDWAVVQGLVPVDFDRLASAATSNTEPGVRAFARGRLAALSAALGLYPLSSRMDRSALVSEPGRTEVRQRLVWVLVRQGRANEALEVAAALDDAPSWDRQSHDLVAAVRRFAALEDPEAAASLAARLPLLTRAQARALRAGIMPPMARVRKR
jgi:hypothetical protein